MFAFQPVPKPTNMKTVSGFAWIDDSTTRSAYIWMMSFYFVFLSRQYRFIHIFVGQKYRFTTNHMWFSLSNLSKQCGVFGSFEAGYTILWLPYVQPKCVLGCTSIILQAIQWGLYTGYGILCVQVSYSHQFHLNAFQAKFEYVYSFVDAL